MNSGSYWTESLVALMLHIVISGSNFVQSS